MIMKLYFIVFILSSTLLISCQKDITVEERDRILKEAFTQIYSQNDSLIIVGLKKIKKYPTQGGLMNVLSLWEKNISSNVEREILKVVRNDEVFKYDSLLIQEIFNKHFDPNSKNDKKKKLIRLLKNSDVKNCKELIKKIENSLNQ